MASCNYKKPPTFDLKIKSYALYSEELKAWQALTEVDENKQALAVALAFPENDSDCIRDKVFSEIGVDKLKSSEGMKELKAFLDGIYKRDDLSEAYESYTVFEKFIKPVQMSMENYVGEFDKLYNKTKKHGIEINQIVLAFKLLNGANLDHPQRQLVLTAVDYEKKTDLFKNMKSALRKFYGEQPITDPRVSDRIKVEPVYMTSYEEADPNSEEVMISQRMNSRWRGGRGGYGGGYRGGYRSGWRSGAGSGNRGWRGRGDSQMKEKPVEKKLNPLDSDGNPIKCRSCESIRHLMKDCPDSWENMKKVLDVQFTRTDKAVLFCGNKTEELQVLVNEAVNAAVLDSACSHNVAGKEWMNCFIESLPESDKENIKRSETEHVYRFGAGDLHQASEQLSLPLNIAGVPLNVSVDVVECDIPLLISKEQMAEWGTVIDLGNDRAKILNNKIDLQTTSAGHYCIPIKENVVQIESCLISALSGDEKESKAAVIKLHKTFLHPSPKRLKSLLADADLLNPTISKLIDAISENCDTCKKFKKTPARPVVSLPMATDFNECVAMDLKIWSKNNNIYFLHLIDVFTRFGLSKCIRSKTAEEIIRGIMTTWIASGFGPPKRFLADNGGEFANDKYRDMCENLNITVHNTAAESPWSNGLCERNHAVVDDNVAKLLEDDPDIDLDIALIWANHAKNCLQMVSGFSPYQLVFGRNPTIPNVLENSPPALEGTTISKEFSNHVNTLHSARRTYVESESAERVKRALRHQLRAMDTVFEKGDEVYFKREDSKKWHGPGRVIAQDGKVVFVRHGSGYIRVHPCRLIKVGQELTTKEDGAVQSEHKGAVKPDKTTQNLSGSQHKRSSNREQRPYEKDSESEDDEITQRSSNEVMEIVLPQQASGNAENDVPPTATNEIPVANNDVQGADNGVQGEERIRSNSKYPKPKENIKYKVRGEDNWNIAEVVSKGGKKGGSNEGYFNVRRHGEDRLVGLELNSEEIEEWRTISKNDEESANVVFIPTHRHDEPEVVKAKDKELQAWLDFNVFDRVEDVGQPSISTRWVITEKSIDGKVGAKARLVARGFEEEDGLQVDSPTASKEVFRLFLALTATKGWKCQTIDIKSAFLQGKEIERETYLKPPKDLQEDGVLWKLNKVVYGLPDASRHWYLSVRNCLIELGCVQSKTEPAFFFWMQNGIVSGFFIMHVDDFLCSGDQAFDEQVIAKITAKFTVGRRETNIFVYLGIQIKQDECGIRVNQDPYIDSLSIANLPKSRSSRKHDDLNQYEVKMLRSAIGNVNWVSSQTRPDVAFDSLDLSINIKEPRVEHLLKANKIIKRLKAESYSLLFPCLGDPQKLNLKVYSDASYCNLSDGVSSGGGHIVFLCGENGLCCPISWSSTKIRRVVRSTIAAETLAMGEATDSCFYIAAILAEILSFKVPIHCLIDNKSLFENVHSTKSVSEKRLRIEVATIKQMIERNEIKSVSWVETDQQLADCLTKKGVNVNKLMNVIVNGHF